MPRLFKQSNPTEVIRQYTNPISGMRIVTYKVDGKPYPYETALQSKYLYQNQLRPIALYHDEDKAILGHYGHIEVQTGYKASIIMAHVKDAINITHSDVLAAFAVQVKDESTDHTV